MFLQPEERSRGAPRGGIDPFAAAKVVMGLPMPTRCPRCGRENDPSFAFCHDCGLALASPPPVAPAPAAAQGAGLPSGSVATAASPSEPESPGAPERRPRRCCANPPAPCTSPRLRPWATSRPSPVVAPAPGRPHGTPASSWSGTTACPARRTPWAREETVCGRPRACSCRRRSDRLAAPRPFTVARRALRVEDLGSVERHLPPVRARRARWPRRGDPARPAAPPRSSRFPARPSGRRRRPWGATDPGYRLRLAQLLEGGGLGEILPLARRART